jgi:hypothetical protein
MGLTQADEIPLENIQPVSTAVTGAEQVDKVAEYAPESAVSGFHPVLPACASVKTRCTICQPLSTTGFSRIFLRLSASTE